MQPPKKFIPAGFVVWAQFFPGEPEFTKGNKPRGSRAEGMRYEEKAQLYLRKLIDKRAKPELPRPEQGPGGPDQGLLGPEWELVPKPWLVFRSGDRNSRDRFCQPDALLVNLEQKQVIIVEIKLQHTSYAWWQVRQLYEPVLKRLYTNYSFSAIEIVKWLDPSVAFPETFFYAESPFDQGAESKFGVHIFDPRGRW